MSRLLDDHGLDYSIHEGKAYYNMTYASRYVGMTDSGLRRKIKAVKAESGIEVPFVYLPFDQQKVFIDKRILDVFKKSVKRGKEQEWFEELRKVVDIVNSEE